MAPTKNSTSNRSLPKDSTASSKATTILPITRKGTVRNKNIQDQNADVVQTRAKRKAVHNSPIKNEKVKRSALGNLTNNANMLTATTTTAQNLDEDAKQQQLKKNVLKDTQNAQAAGGVANDVGLSKITTRAASKNAKRAVTTTTTTLASTKTVTKNENAQKVGGPPPTKLLPPPAPVGTNNSKLAAHKSSRRISNEFNQTEDSLYMSALEDVSSSESMRLSGNFDAVKRRSLLLHQNKQQQQHRQQENKEIKAEKCDDDGIKNEIKNQVDDDADANDDDDDESGNYKDDLSFIITPVPSDVEDFDKANWNDPFQVSNYAMDIFNYLKSRESLFIIDDYMVRQVHLSKWMRSLLVDWMVEVQETFELNHETLYLAVKLVDLFLCKVIIQKERLQLLGAAALFIACKYDERTPPLIDDFLYICDGAYKHDELVKMEMTVLRTVDYDLGIPLSYRFLRRYARCAKVTMPTLTLARYALELSLMDYETTSLSDSRLACATLFIALRLHGGQKVWSATLEYYTGYRLIDFADIVPLLNAAMHRKPKGTIKNIRNKYSHKIFHEVAKVKLLTTEKLFENELDFKNIIIGGSTKIGDEGNKNLISEI